MSTKSSIIQKVKLSFLLVIAIQYSQGTSLKDVLLASKRAVESALVDENVDVLQRYYFTSKKDQSIWSIAPRENRQIYYLDSGIDHFTFIEKLLKKVANHFELCSGINEKIIKAQCFYDFSYILKDTEKGSRWDSSMGITFESRAKFGTLYLCFAAMHTHLMIISNHYIKAVSNDKSTEMKVKKFSDILRSTITRIFKYDGAMEAWYTDNIGPAEVCEIRTHFWKEFIGECETRWQINKVIRPKVFSPAFSGAHRPQVSSKRSYTNATAGNNVEMDEFDAVSKESDFKSNEHDSILAIADRIGGSIGVNQKRYRVQIYDNTRREVLFESYMTSDVSSRGSTLDILAEKALRVRAGAEKVALEKIQKFNNETYGVVRYLLDKGVAILQK